MKKIYLICLLTFLSTGGCKETESKTQETKEIGKEPVSTYYFIRHAEKDRSDPNNDNPHLTEVGKQRAEKWLELFGEVKFDAVYATSFHRTKETALPTVMKHNLELKTYNPRTININKFLEETQGQNVLVVGHSESTPNFVNSILGIKKYQHIDDSAFDNYFIVKIENGNITDEKLFMP